MDSILIQNYKGKRVICIKRVIYSKIRLKIVKKLLKLRLHAMYWVSGDFRESNSPQMYHNGEKVEESDFCLRRAVLILCLFPPLL